MRHYRLLCMLAWLPLIGGCRTHSTWTQRPMPMNGAPAITPDRPIRVTRMNGSVIVLQLPRVTGDSVTGSVGVPPERMAIPLHDVRRIDEQIREIDKLGTAANVAKGTGTVLALVVGGMMIWLLSMYNSDSR